MTWNDIADFPNVVARKSIQCYRQLGKSGKPARHGDHKAEWTVLACVLQVYAKGQDDYAIQVVSLGTGLKCLPYSKLCKQGQLVHDSHAETIARRGFLSYVMDQIGKPDGPFRATGEGRVILRPGYTFHMYISQSPCGDASMTGIAETQTAESLAAFQAGSKRKSTFDIAHLTNNIYANKKRKTNLPQEAFQRGRYGFDDLGVLRTKPGRLDSEPTLCMSCSDKLARWNALGIQSAVLSDILEKPIYLESIVIGDLFDQPSLERALYGRMQNLELPAPYALHRPKIYHTTESFEASKPVLELKYATVIPSGTAILWISGASKSEVLVHGRKQGAPKGKPTNSKTRSSIAKLALFQKFLECVPLCRPLTEQDKEMTYYEWKQRATAYQQAKTCLLDQCFSQWVQTPKEFEEFTA
ncbi:adenosine deaminase/editase [Fennellomyces sp. T-0311]|nr:adenosine deaminase/editase [Fennellomyces sp. T-0311]